MPDNDLSEIEMRAWWHEQLLESVNRLAASYDEQRTWLDSLPVSVPDAGELGSEFSDYARFAADLASHGLISIQALEPIQRLDRFMQSLSGLANAKFWFFSSLASDPNWERIREMAREIQRLLPTGNERSPETGSVN